MTFLYSFGDVLKLFSYVFGDVLVLTFCNVLVLTFCNVLVVTFCNVLVTYYDGISFNLSVVVDKAVKFVSVGKFCCPTFFFLRSIRSNVFGHINDLIK